MGEKRKGIGAKIENMTKGIEIEGGCFGQVRRLRGVILEGEEIEGGHFGEVNPFNLFTFQNDPPSISSLRLDDPPQSPHFPKCPISSQTIKYSHYSQTKKNHKKFLN